MSGQVGWGVLAWVLAIAFFLPVLWMVLTAFKPESAAETWPPRFTFSPTLAEFRLVFSGWGPFVTHSVVATVGSTILVLVLGVPAAYALSVHPVGRWPVHRDEPAAGDLDDPLVHARGPQGTARGGAAGRCRADQGDHRGDPAGGLDPGWCPPRSFA
jgi:hypothetical protein